MKIIELTGSRSEIVQHPLPADDPKQRRPDIALAKQVLNWEPTIALQEGLARTVDYFRRQIGG
jgi:UDP-glucuronate decarboxylase